MLIAEARAVACVAFTVSRQALHEGPSEIAVGQKQASSGHADNAESISPHWAGQFSCRRSK